MSKTTNQPTHPSEGKLALRVLVVEDSEFDARMLVGLLRAGGFEPEFERVETEGGMRTALGQAQWEVILADYNLPDFSAPRALEVLKESQLDIPFIIVSGGIGEDTAVAAMKSGAHDYLMKGNLARLVSGRGAGIARGFGAILTEADGQGFASERVEAPFVDREHFGHHSGAGL